MFVLHKLHPLAINIIVATINLCQTKQFYMQFEVCKIVSFKIFVMYMGQWNI